MKIYILIFFAFVSLFAYTSCEDHKEDHLDEYSTILYFLESGEVPLKLFDAGENTKASVTISKSGSEMSSSSTVSVIELSEALLNAYNEENETEYVLLPTTCYSFEKQEFTLTEKKPYQTLEIELNPNLIKGLPEIEGEYVLGLDLENAQDSINAKKRYVFLVPEILTPMVSFPTSVNDDVVFTAESDAEISFPIPISVSEGLDNQWDFDCEVEIDESLIDDYNAKYETSFQLLPEDAYTMNSTVSFKSGEQSSTVEVKITRSDLRFGEYILPLRLVSVSKSEFEVESTASTSIIPISYTPPNPPEIALSLEMLSTNAQEPSEGPIENIIDGNNETFFHSTWSSAVFSEYGHYIQIKLNNPINLAQFAYTTRHNNNNGTPKLIELYTSTDGVTWTLLSTINRGLPEGVAADYTSTVYQTNQPFSYFRIGIKESKGGAMNETASASFAISELKFFGQLMN